MTYVLPYHMPRRRCTNCRRIWFTDAPRYWATGRHCPDCFPHLHPGMLPDDAPVTT